MAEDYLFLACRFCGEGVMAAKLSAGWDADGGISQPGSFVGKHLGRCGIPALRRQSSLDIHVGDLVKQMIVLVTQKDVNWMGYLTPEDEKNGHGGCRIKPELRITEIKSLGPVA